MPPARPAASPTRLTVLGRVNALLAALAGLPARVIYEAVLTEVPDAARFFPRTVLWQWAHVASTHTPAQTTSDDT